MASGLLIGPFRAFQNMQVLLYDLAKWGLLKYNASVVMLSRLFPKNPHPVSVCKTAANYE